MDEKKNIFRDFKEKTEGMTFKEKLSYFWEYYRLLTLVVCFSVIVVVSITKSVIVGSLTDPVVSIGVVNDVDIYYHDEIEAAINATFPESTGFHAPSVSSFTSPGNTSDMYSAVQLAAYLSAGQLDGMICDRETLETCDGYGVSYEWVSLEGSSFGDVLAETGMKEVYYIWLTDSERTEAAKSCLEVIKALP